ncbi:MipA/OmpV family protein [Glaciecola sp. MH2013]|uniref:MipA/OmpV family protein n=1 Tax=Glaciecola sp. MH2013 TaxID=2785524 RepID=UPI00189E77F7|nr:MipA/OmpV family protein [Glaciecola sp. MH2013]MBF7074249.1 MipA/OmpV family protein [Glaciecola sp. MH2013]
MRIIVGNRVVNSATFNSHFTRLCALLLVLSPCAAYANESSEASIERSAVSASAISSVKTEVLEADNGVSLGNDVGEADIRIERSLTGFEGVNEELSLWELGAGGGSFNTAKYPASGDSRFNTAVLPFIVYRGDTFRIGDGGGARAVVVEQKNFEVDFSFGAALPSDSEDNTAREGMPELDFLLEIGPQAIYMLGNYDFDKNAAGDSTGTDYGKGRLDLRLQARAVFSTDFGSIDDRGFILEPQISYQHRGFKHPDTALTLSVGAIFATERTHDYFYEVAPEFATAERPAYDAKSGYLGSELSLGLSFRVNKDIRAFIGSSAQFHSRAANKDSPLFEKEVTYTIGAAFVWRFYKSERKANW